MGIDGKKFGFKKVDKAVRSKEEEREKMLKEVNDSHEKALEKARLCLHSPLLLLS